MLKRVKHYLCLRLSIFYRFIGEKYTCFHSFSFVDGQQASKDVYLQLAKEVQQFKYYEVDRFEEELGYAINTSWLNKLALHTQVVIKNSTLCYAHGRVLYTALSQYIKKHQFIYPSSRLTIFETGTARGFSALCMAKALQDQNQFATIVTFDMLPHQTRMYWNCIDDCEGPRTRAELLEPWKSLSQKYIIFHQGDTRIELPKVKVERINFAFLDGAHTYKDVLFEFKQICDYQISGDMVIYDDYTPTQYPGLVRAVDEICKIYDYKRTNLKANNGRGYVVTVKK